MTDVINRLTEIVFVAIIMKGLLLLFEENSYYKYLQLFVQFILIYLICQVLAKYVTSVMHDVINIFSGNSDMLERLLREFMGAEG